MKAAKGNYNNATPSLGVKFVRKANMWCAYRHNVQGQQNKIEWSTTEEEAFSKFEQLSA